MRQLIVRIWETLFGSVANEENDNCHELLLQRIKECSDLQRRLIESQQQKTDFVTEANQLNTIVSELERRERHAVAWAEELENRVEHLEKQCCHEMNERDVLQMRLHRETEQTRALIAAAVELNKQVATWEQAIKNIKENFPKEWDDATTTKTTN